MYKKIEKRSDLLRDSEYSNDRRIIQFYSEQRQHAEKLFDDTRNQINQFILDGVNNNKPILYQNLEWEIEKHKEHVEKMLNRILMIEYDDESWYCTHKQFSDLEIQYMTDEFHNDLRKLLCTYYDILKLRIIKT